MNDGKVVDELFSKLVYLTNQMNSYGEKIYELQEVEKVLRALLAKFYHIVMAIEESKYFSEVSLKNFSIS